MTFNKFHDSKIYVIKSLNPSITEKYFGSTTMSLHQRMNLHKSAYKTYKCNNKKSKSTVLQLFDDHGVDNFTIELVLHCICECRKDLLKIECDYIDRNECVNKNKPYRTPEDTRELKRLTSAKYYLNNRIKHIEAVKFRYHFLKYLSSTTDNWDAVGVDEPSE